MTEFYVENVVTGKDIERCVMPYCGKETPYLRSTPVDQRLHYVDGAGQLCAPCYNETFGGDYGIR